MKKLTKFCVFALAGTMMFALVSCGSSSASNASSGASSATKSESSESDLAYVQGKGKLVVGITDFEPMDYMDADGNWIGFDADMATAFAKSLGVDVEFVEINWDNKILELNNSSIDCVWNGMTLTDEVTSSMECSNAYMNNTQVVVVNEKDKDLNTVELLSKLSFAVESGSAGQDMAEQFEFNFTPVTAQSDALMEVASGTSDAAIIDSLMAGAMIGEGTGYPDLVYTISLNADEGERYGVGFRKGSDLAEALNEFFADSYADGSMQKCAETYGVQAALIEQ